jgi:hypothetical protein
MQVHLFRIYRAFPISPFPISPFAISPFAISAILSDRRQTIVIPQSAANAAIPPS